MMFAEPQWLFAILLVPFLYFFCISITRKQEKEFSRFFSRVLWDKILTGVSWGQSIKKFGILHLAIVFFLIAMARPQWGEEVREVEVNGMDLMVALDVSSSMDVEDVVPSRLRKAKRSLKYMLERLQGDRVGLVVFAGSGFLASPLTNDYTYLSEMLDTIGPQSVQSQGTDIGLGLEVAIAALDRGSEIGTQLGQNVNEKARAILLISDGEDLEQNALAGAEKVKKAGIRFFASGLGTEEGGPIPLRSEEGDLKGYRLDSSRKQIVSKFTPGALQEIASTAGGEYFSLTDGEKEMDELLKKLGTIEKSERGKVSQRIPLERFQIPLFIAILLLMFELSLSAFKKFPQRMGTFVVLFCFSHLFSPPSQADLLKSYEAYQRNNKGVDAFQFERFDESQREIGTALILEPHSLALRFNQAVVQFTKNDPKNEENQIEAIKNFQEIVAQSDGARDELIKALASYNLGVLYHETKEMENAIRSFLQVIESAQKIKDKNEKISLELETDARKKLEQFFQKQNQQGGKGEKGDQKDKDDKKDDKDEKSGDKDSDKDQKENKKNQNQKVERGNQKKPFQSENLSEEDAEKVLKGLSENDQKLQKKMQKEQGGAPKNQGKDW